MDDVYLEHTGSKHAYVSYNTILQVEDVGRGYVIVMMPNSQKAYFAKRVRDIVVDYFKE